jgi:hypothetical protein
VNRGITILKLMEELRQMPEYALFVELQGFSASIYTFDRNYQELVDLINFLANNPKADALHWLRNRDKLMVAMRDVIRLLHNYVAAAMSLIDHTRRLHKRLYSELGNFSDYQTKVNSEFAQDPHAQFVKCLRQYCQHYKAPNLDITTSWNQGDEKISRSFNLLKEDLISFDGWSATALKYLEHANEKISILQIIKEYRDKVIEFYIWFQKRQEEIHADELERFKKKESELLSLMLEDKIDMSFAESRQGIPHRKDDIFISIFTSREFDEIDAIPRNSPNRALRAIEILEEKFFRINDQTKAKIIELYTLPDITPQLDGRET